MKHCQKCGKEIMDEAVICPGCGCSVNAQKADSGKNAKKNEFVPKKAKRASLFGILSMILFAPLAIPSIILAVSSKKETGGVMCKQAVTGIVFSIIGLCLWIGGLLLYFSGVTSI